MPRRKDEPGFSRRSFLKTVGAGGVAAGVLTKSPVKGPPVAERTLLGKSIKRLDGPVKAQGKAKYTYDIVRPGMLYGESPKARWGAR